jgi:hypothetical protein
MITRTMRGSETFTKPACIRAFIPFSSVVVRLILHVL